MRPGWGGFAWPLDSISCISHILPPSLQLMLTEHEVTQTLTSFPTELWHVFLPSDIMTLACYIMHRSRCKWSRWYCCFCHNFNEVSTVQNKKVWCLIFGKGSYDGIYMYIMEVLLLWRLLNRKAAKRTIKTYSSMVFLFTLVVQLNNHQHPTCPSGHKPFRIILICKQCNCRRAGMRLRKTT